LDGNNFDSIPKEIGLLTNLKELSISRNRIELISFDISLMTKLEKLFLYANPIKSITKDITSLTNLFQLHLDDVQKEMIPQKLSNIIVLH
jgi:Leucine-rich repeat (LRR) protein